MRRLALVLALLSSGCATIVKGGRTHLDIASPTPDAEAVVKSYKGRDVYEGPLPAHVEVSKGDSYVVTISAPGHKPQRIAVTQSLQGWTFGNVILVIPILWGVGIAVDAMSGALWSLSPDEIQVRLVKLPAPPPPAVAPAPPPPADAPILN